MGALPEAGVPRVIFKCDVTAYSARSASMGFTMAARRAGTRLAANAEMHSRNETAG